MHKRLYNEKVIKKISHQNFLNHLNCNLMLYKHRIYPYTLSKYRNYFYILNKELFVSKSVILNRARYPGVQFKFGLPTFFLRISRLISWKQTLQIISNKNKFIEQKVHNFYKFFFSNNESKKIINIFSKFDLHLNILQPQEWYPEYKTINNKENFKNTPYNKTTHFDQEKPIIIDIKSILQSSRIFDEIAEKQKTLSFKYQNKIESIKTILTDSSIHSLRRFSLIDSNLTTKNEIIGRKIWKAIKKDNESLNGQKEIHSTRKNSNESLVEAEIFLRVKANPARKANLKNILDVRDNKYWPHNRNESLMIHGRFASGLELSDKQKVLPSFSSFIHKDYKLSIDSHQTNQITSIIKSESNKLIDLDVLPNLIHKKSSEIINEPKTDIQPVKADTQAPHQMLKPIGIVETFSENRGIDVEHLADKVMNLIEQRLKTEQERRGIFI